MSEAMASAEMSDLIRAEIRAAGGVISFARFMELALYAPGLGYYERAAQVVGREGDFYTSVSVGPVFGELLAFQFAEWMESDSPFQIVEVGAHDGRLARDILGWFRQWRPALAGAVEYWIVEPSPIRREWQAKTLSKFDGQVRWTSAVPDSGARLATDLPAPISQLPPIRGVIFANELLDALPVHRLGWDAAKHTWFEWGVAAQADGFEWTRLNLPPAAVSVPVLPDELLAVLPDGFTTEACPAAVAWWRNAALSLIEGRLLTFDYGLEATEFFLPQRAGGTLRGYHRHRFADHVLAQPGEQDLTAQVNFTALQHAGEAAGLSTEAFTRQSQWLTGIMARTGAVPNRFESWNAQRIRQFQTLTHPEHLGRAFSVLVQRREAHQ